MRISIIFSIAAITMSSATSFSQEPVLPATPPDVIVQNETKVVDDFGKQSYLPAIGILYFSSGISTALAKSTINNGSAGVLANTKSVWTSFDYLLGYGISDNLALGVKGSISLSDSTENTYGPGSTINGVSTTSKRTGWYEPEFAALWRIRNNVESKMRIHIGATAKPKLQKAKFATTSSDGNFGSGGNTYSVSAEIFKEVKNLEFGFSISRYFIQLSESQSASDSTKTSEDSEHESTNFRLSLYGATSEDIKVGGSLLLSSTDSYITDSLTNAVSTSKIKYDSSQSSALELVGILKIEKNSMLKFSIQTILDSTSGAVSGTNKLTASSSGNSLGLAWIQEIN